MSDPSRLVARYQQLRKVGMEVSHALTGRLSKEMLHEGARDLGMLRNDILVFDGEGEMAILMDHCIHDLYQQGQNTAEKYLDEAPYPPGSDQALLLQGTADACYAILEVESVEPGVGVRVRDLARDPHFLLIDIGFSHSCRPGWLLATRLIVAEGIAMTGGAALPIGALPPDDPSGLEEQLVDRARSLLAGTPEERGKAIGAFIRMFLEAGASEHLGYAEPGERASRRRGPPAALPFDPRQVGQPAPLTPR